MSASKMEKENLPISNRRPFKTEAFVNREGELKIVLKKVAEAQENGRVAEPVVNYWGVSGVGKSWLLQEIAERLRFKGGENAGIRPSFAIYISLITESGESKSIETLCKALAEQLLSQLEGELATEEIEITKAILATGESRTSISLFTAMTKKFVPVFLFDEVEMLKPTEWERFEEQLLEELALTEQMVLVIAGRKQITNWHRFEVRRRVIEQESSYVKPFKRKEVAELVENRAYQMPAEWLYIFSAGNPHLIDELATDLQKAFPNEPITLEQIQKHHQQLATVLANYEKELLKRIEGDAGELRKVIHVVSPLRAYRLEALRYMLSAQEKTTQFSSVGYHLRLLRELDQKTEIVWWSRAYRAYVTDPVARQVMNRWRLLNDKETYITRQEQAIAMYTKWANEYPRNSEEFIQEIWFHLACLYLADDTDEEEDEISTRILAWLQFARDNLSEDRLLILQQQLDPKHDPELCELLPEEIHTEIMQELTKRFKE